MAKQLQNPLKLFYSYAREDAALRLELARHLNTLERAAIIQTWHDSNIEIGTEWDLKIQEKLAEADIILMLLSSDFLYSDYINQKEIPLALRRYDDPDDSVLVVPILLRNCFWDISPISGLQLLPRSGKPISRSEDRDTAFTEITKELYQIIHKKKSPA
ncbi:MAG: toll/interleukin-1 receptor domain-containing protein [Saprospiraceae bacterium]